MSSINVIHASFFVRTRMMVIRSCFDRTEAFRKIHNYETIVTLLDSIKEDVPMCQKIIGALPVELHQIYVQEKENHSK